MITESTLIYPSYLDTVRPRHSYSGQPLIRLLPPASTCPASHVSLTLAFWLTAVHLPLQRITLTALVPRSGCLRRQRRLLYTRFSIAVGGNSAQGGRCLCYRKATPARGDATPAIKAVFDLVKAVCPSHALPGLDGPPGLAAVPLP